MDVIKMIHVKGQAAKRLQANPVEKNMKFWECMLSIKEWSSE